ncbi:hypothetical protein [Microbacterium sp. gxy059]|uniref:hypothetical protein n=1 Tax=Microbacterium sp. gxy059 TaxID=2957199 RepID=UPI003D9878B9
MITAREKGRRLEVIIGGGEDALTFLVPPVPARVGAELLADWVGIKFGATPPEDAPAKATTLAQRVLGDEVFEQISDLRAAEQTDVVNVAFMWNVQGGGIELVQTYISDGMGKAHERLLKTTGLADVHSLLRTSLDSASENLTSAAVSPATSTRSGGETSSKDEGQRPTTASTSS